MVCAGKKGQVTIFVIVGILLIVVVAMILFMQKSYQNMPEPDHNSLELRNSMEEYVGDCMELILEEGIQKMALQGGDLYDIGCEQNNCQSIGDVRWVERPKPMQTGANIFGRDCLPFTWQGESYCVSYGIREYSRYNPSPPHYDGDDPLYPKQDYDLDNPDELPVLGDNDLRKLCDTEGPNKRDSEQAYSVSCMIKNYDAFYANEYRNYSMQEQLAYYVEENIGECADFQPWIDKGYEINKSEPNATLIWGNNDITLDLEYDIFNITGLDMKQQGMRVSNSFNIRLKRMYEFIHNLIEKEISDINFEPDYELDYALVDKYVQGFVVRQQEDVCSICTDTLRVSNADGSAARSLKAEADDILQITDENTVVGGEPLTFNIAVRNRRPVIDVDTIGFEGGTPFFNNPLMMRITAKDPDNNDALTIRFNGEYSVLPWKYDCRGRQLITCGQDVGNDMDWGLVWTESFPRAGNWLSNRWVQQPTEEIIWSINAGMRSREDVYSGYEKLLRQDEQLSITTTLAARHIMRTNQEIQIIAIDESGAYDSHEQSYRCCKDGSGIRTHNSAGSNMLFDYR